ncbi:MAG: hypothetical protein WDO14_03475 [Bacteroidota bacterium]
MKLALNDYIYIYLFRIRNATIDPCVADGNCELFLFCSGYFAVIKALNDTPTSEVLTHGDSLLIRIVNVMDSESHWYYRGKDVGSPDLRFLGANHCWQFNEKATSYIIWLRTSWIQIVG